MYLSRSGLRLFVREEIKNKDAGGGRVALPPSTAGRAFNPLSENNEDLARVDLVPFLDLDLLDRAV